MNELNRASGYSPGVGPGAFRYPVSLRDTVSVGPTGDQQRCGAVQAASPTLPFERFVTNCVRRFHMERCGLQYVKQLRAGIENANEPGVWLRSPGR